jgi:hypothetical protein
MSFRDDLVKDHLEQKHRASQQPPSYVLMLHMNPDAYNLDLHLCVQHVLLDHLNIGAADTEKAIKGAANSGASVIKPVTKDVGESMMQRVETCMVLLLSTNFKVALELL